jgi:aerotaxis receptor
MRKNLPVTQREVTLRPGSRLISTTDLKGVMTYCNEDFVAISGYARDELIGQPHNLIRHPDMPPSVFQGMWTYLKAGKAWMGVVKNRTKSGDHYWVSAYVTPIFEQGRMVGYESVRVAPTRDQVARAEALYARLGAGSGRSLAQPLRALVGDGWPFGLSLLLGLLALLLESPGLAVAMLVLGHALGALAARWALDRRLRALLALRPDAFADPVVAQTYSGERGLMARLAMVLKSEEARIRTALVRIDDQAEWLADQARASQDYIEQGAAAIARQRQETDQVASAMNQMTASIQEVAESVTANAREAEEANQLAGLGSRRSAEALDAIEELVGRVNGIGAAIEKLGAATQSIGEAASLISDIAEQTNLLALNAAIEAARAGEQGARIRGGGGRGPVAGPADSGVDGADSGGDRRIPAAGGHHGAGDPGRRDGGRAGPGQGARGGKLPACDRGLDPEHFRAFHQHVRRLRAAEPGGGGDQPSGGAHRRTGGPQRPAGRGRPGQQPPPERAVPGAQGLGPAVHSSRRLARISHRSPASLADCAGYRHYRSFAAEID